MLQGWPLFLVCAMATVATIVMARRQARAWFWLGALFFVLRLPPELGLAACVVGWVVICRTSNPRSKSGEGELR